MDGNPLLSEEEPPQGAEEAKAKKAEETIAEPEYRTEESRETEKATKEVDWEKFLENRSQQQSSGTSAVDRDRRRGRRRAGRE